MTVPTCRHIVDQQPVYDPVNGGYQQAPVYCDAVAVRIWTDGGGQQRPVCLIHARMHPHAPRCYAGDDADG